MSALQPRDQGIVDKLTGKVEALQKEAAGLEAAGDKERAENRRRDARGVQRELDNYLVDTRELRDDYPIQQAADDLQARREAPAREARAARLRAERNERLRSYPTMRGSPTKDKSIGSDPPEFPA